jgi:hypothetical protein
MILLYFLTDLMRDPKRQEVFSHDPWTTMRQAGLTDEQARIVWQQDAGALGAALAGEVLAFASSHKAPYPSSAVRVMSVTPAQGAVGTVALVTVEGSFFDDAATCALRSGDTSIPGEVTAVVSDFRSTMQVTFDLTKDASPGLWNVEVTNGPDGLSALPRAFEITAPDPVPSPDAE